MNTEGATDYWNPSVEDLPNELLLRILLNIDNKSLSNALLVCKKWHDINDEMIGRKLFVGRQCQLVPHDGDRYVHKYVDVFEISKIGIRECFVGEIVEPTRGMTLWTRLFSKMKHILFSEAKDPEFKYPYLVQTLHFDGPIPASYFESMMKNVFNLTKLELHMTAFCCLNASNLVELGQNWKSLQDLSIWGHKLTDGLFTDFYESKKIIPNMLIFLTNDFRALKYFALEYPFDIRDDKKLTREVFSFLRRHTELSTMRICINIPISDEGTSDFDSYEDLEWKRDARVVSRLLKLTNLELIVSSMRKVHLTKVWMAFVEHQRNLQNVTVLSFRVPSGLLSTICENNKACISTLFISRILMTNNPNQPVQLDGSMFAPCDQLTSITVEGMLHNSTTAGLTSTRLLPKSLTTLEIGGLLLPHTDAHDLFFELPNLKSICLTDVGNRGQFGLTIETLKLVIINRRIATVNIYRSICGDYPAAGIHNGDPNGQTLIKQRPYEILEMTMNDQGYYENLQRQNFFGDFDDD